MKKIFKEAKFKDFKGNERSFTVCGVLLDEKDGVTMATVVQNEDGVLNQRHKEDDDFMEFPENTLRIGISFCHEHDQAKSELGKTLAEGRALKEDKANCVFTSTNSLLLNMRMAHQIVDYVVSDIQYAPGKYIPGYNEMEERYLKKSTEGKKVDEQD